MKENVFKKWGTCHHSLLALLLECDYADLALVTLQHRGVEVPVELVEGLAACNQFLIENPQVVWPARKIALVFLNGFRDPIGWPEGLEATIEKYVAVAALPESAEEEEDYWE